MARLLNVLAASDTEAWTLGSPQQEEIDTVFGNDAGDDALPWSNALPINLDKFGNIFTVILRWQGGNKRPCFVWKNVSGAWTDNPILSLDDGNVGELAVDQAMLAYDSANDIIHALWVGQAGPTGIVYRRYVFIRDGSNNITGIDWDYTDGTDTNTRLATRTNLQLDSGAVSYTTMQLLILTDTAYGPYGALVAIWNAAGTGGTEMRASMCVFGSDPQHGKTAANWTNLGLTTTNAAYGTTVNVAYNALVSRSESGATILPVVARKRAGTHANDLYVGYCDTPVNNGGYVWMYTRLGWNAASHNWTTMTTPATICGISRSGADIGYPLKQQLMSAWAEDTANDRMYVGLASWKDDAHGDTWSFAKVNSADAITVVDVYSAGGVHTYAPTGSIAFDQARGLLVVAYERSGDCFGLVQLYNDMTPQGSAVVFTTTSVDIPSLMLDATVGNQIPVIYRDIVNTPNPPYHAHFASIPWTH